MDQQELNESNQVTVDGDGDAERLLGSSSNLSSIGSILVDHRRNLVNPIQNQQSCGGCWGLCLFIPFRIHSLLFYIYF